MNTDHKGIILIGENRSIPRKLVPVTFRPRQIPNELDWLDLGLNSGLRDETGD